MPSGSGSLALLFKIVVDSKDAESALNSLKKQVDSSSGAASNLTPELDQLSKKLLGMSGAGGETTSALTGVTEAIGGMTGAITLGAVAALAALAAGLAACVKQAISLGSELHDLSQVTGLSVENLSALRVAAETSGSSLQELSSAFVRFERAAADGTDKAEEALKRFGLTAAQVAEDPQESFDQFLKKFNEIGPSAQRTADSMALFGRGAARLIPTFSEMQDGLEGARKKAEELGIMFSPELANKADEVGDKFDIFKMQIEAIFVKMGQELLPVMDDLAKAVAEVTKELGFMVGAMARAVDVMPELQAGWLTMRAIWNAIRDDIKAHGGFAEIVTPPGPAQVSPWNVFGSKVTGVLQGILDMKDPLKSLQQVVDNVPDVKPPELDVSGNLKKLTAGGLEAGKLFEKTLKDQRDQMLKNEILAGLGLLKVKKDKATKEKDPTFEADKESAQARLDLAKRTAAEEQQLFKQDLEQKIIDQDRFAAFMIASETQLALARRQAVLDQEEVAIRSAKTPDERAAIHRKAANEIANIDSELLIRQREIERQRVKANAAADEQLIDNAIALDEKERKLIEDRNAFRIKSEIATQKAIADAIDSEDVKSPFEVGMGAGVIADIHSTVDALDPATKAWREATLAIDGYNQALQRGELSFADFPAIVQSIIDGLINMTLQLLLAGKGWDALKVAMKAIPLIFLDQFVKQVKKMTDAFIETGKTGPAALKQLVAGTIKAVAQMASTWAMYMFEYAIAMLAIQDYKSAALAFAAGVGLEAVAIALGFVANKMSKGAEGGASASAQVIQPPNTTINVGGGGTAQLGGTPGDLFGAFIESNNRQTAAVTQLHEKIGSMNPGDVVTVAANTSPSAFATGVSNATKSNSSFVRSLGLTLQPT